MQMMQMISMMMINQSKYVTEEGDETSEDDVTGYVDEIGEDDAMGRMMKLLKTLSLKQ